MNDPNDLAGTERAHLAISAPIVATIGGVVSAHLEACSYSSICSPDSSRLRVCSDLPRETSFRRSARVLIFPQAVVPR